jgi:hypothetical protein
MGGTDTTRDTASPVAGPIWINGATWGRDPFLGAISYAEWRR